MGQHDMSLGGPSYMTSVNPQSMQPIPMAGVPMSYPPYHESLGYNTLGDFDDGSAPENLGYGAQGVYPSEYDYPDPNSYG